MGYGPMAQRGDPKTGEGEKAKDRKNSRSLSGLRRRRNTIQCRSGDLAERRSGYCRWGVEKEKRGKKGKVKDGRIDQEWGGVTYLMGIKSREGLVDTRETERKVLKLPEKKKRMGMEMHDVHF